MNCYSKASTKHKIWFREGQPMSWTKYGKSIRKLRLSLEKALLFLEKFLFFSSQFLQNTSKGSNPTLSFSCNPLYLPSGSVEPPSPSNKTPIPHLTRGKSRTITPRYITMKKKMINHVIIIQAPMKTTRKDTAFFETNNEKCSRYTSTPLSM